MKRGRAKLGTTLTSGPPMMEPRLIRPVGRIRTMSIAKSVLLFMPAAVAEIGGAWLVWQAVREDKAWWLAGLGVIALD